jgi:hypothetical protein
MCNLELHIFQPIKISKIPLPRKVFFCTFARLKEIETR